MGLHFVEVDDEKTAFLGGVKIKTRYHHEATFADMDGQLGWW